MIQNTPVNLKRQSTMTCLFLSLLAMATIPAPVVSQNNDDQLEQYKMEILAAETDFAKMVRTEGMQAAFLAYASEQAVLSRNNKLIKGKQAMNEYFDSQTLSEIQLQWAPDFIDVSASGDLGYTYGNYTLRARNAEGEWIQDTGVFHTVWKRNQAGQWRFVWD